MSDAAQVPTLTRDLIAARFPPPFVDEGPVSASLSEREITANLDIALTQRDVERRGVWLFAYGSLLWNPDFPFVEKRSGSLRGYHRRFCLWQWRYRGTRACPNLMLALDRGGCCKGVLYRVAAPDVRTKLAGVWRREMLGNAYCPRWLRAETAEGPVESIAFVINRDGERYAGRLTEAKVADFMAAACGHRGSGAEYLLETVMALEAAGLRDAMLWRMQALVAERLAAATPDPGEAEPS